MERRTPVLFLAVICLTLLAISVPLHLRTRAVAHRATCRARIMQCALAIRGYVAQWGGWSHPDPSYYVKELGYKLTSETGYFGEPPPWYSADALNPTRSQEHAAGIEALRCPLDSAPAIIMNGIPSSYTFIQSWPRAGVMNPAPPSEVPLLIEFGRRHSAADNPEVRGGHCMFLDMHVEIRADQARLEKRAIGSN